MKSVIYLSGNHRLTLWPILKSIFHCLLCGSKGFTIHWTMANGKFHETECMKCGKKINGGLTDGTRILW